MLLAAAALTALLRHWVDTRVVVGVVFINALVGFIQEGKAERALQTIQIMLSLHARARRNGRFITIPAKNIVPGDIVLIHSGDRVPADMRDCSKSNSMQVQESVLTGESEAVEKGIEKINKDAAVGDRTCMAYTGTSDKWHW